MRAVFWYPAADSILMTMRRSETTQPPHPTHTLVTRPDNHRMIQLAVEVIAQCLVRIVPPIWPILATKLNEVQIFSEITMIFCETKGRSCALWRRIVFFYNFIFVLQCKRGVIDRRSIFEKSFRTWKDSATAKGIHDSISSEEVSVKQATLINVNWFGIFACCRYLEKNKRDLNADTTNKADNITA